ncbi:MAG: MFS transporter [Solobacterium sp.]|nr:MFS transporter [Solobacterium sp.]
MTKINTGQNNKAPLWLFSFVQAGFWMSFCVSVSFAAVYLQALAYSNSALGLILALGSTVGVTVSLALSAWIDSNTKITAKKLIPCILAFQTVSAVILFLINQRCFAVSAAFVAYIGFCTVVNSLSLKLYADAEQAGYGIDYGFTRGVGSVAYVLISVVLGFLIEKISCRALPGTGLILCAVQYLAFFLFARYAVAGKKAGTFGERNSSLPVFLKNHPRYALFLTGVVLIYFGHSTACNFLINLTRHVGGDASDMGMINAFKGMVEIPMMFLYARFFSKGRHARALRISAVFFEIKLLAFILSANVWHLTAGFIFQAPSYALYMTAVVPYVEETIDYQDSAKAQSLAFTTTTFGGMLASLIGGRLYDTLPVTSTLWIAFAVGAAGMVIMFLGTRKTEQS